MEPKDIWEVCGKPHDMHRRKKNRLREGHEETKVSSEENIWGVNLEKLRVESITWDWELHYGEVDKIVYILFFTRGNKHCHW